jgi:hypothetical protein
VVQINFAKTLSPRNTRQNANVQNSEFRTESFFILRQFAPVTPEGCAKAGDPQAVLILSPHSRYPCNRGCSYNSERFLQTFA